MNKFIYLLTLLAISLSLLAQNINKNITNDWNNDRYEIHGDGTVTDTVTGLMWMQCSLGQSQNSNCSGNATKYNWEEALVLSENYSIDEYTDWRLPNIKELSSLTARDRLDPAINSTIFPNAASDGYWSASPDTDDSYAWRIHLFAGNSGYDERNDDNYVRLVRTVW